MKKILLLYGVLLVSISLWKCTSNDTNIYERDEDVQLITYNGYEIEMISCQYDEAIGLVDCIFEIERLDGTDIGLDSLDCSWGDNYYLMSCATGKHTKECEYDSINNKKYITFEQVARIWESEESKGTIELYDDEERVGVFKLTPDSIHCETFLVDESKTIYITKNGLCAKGDFAFMPDTQLTIVYEDGSTIEVFKDGRDNYEAGNWGGSSGEGSNVYTFIFHQVQDKEVEKIVYNGEEI